MLIDPSKKSDHKKKHSFLNLLSQKIGAFQRLAQLKKEGKNNIPKAINKVSKLQQRLHNQELWKKRKTEEK
jgi:hypothetical protein